jgi:hypothetical protein
MTRVDLEKRLPGHVVWYRYMPFGQRRLIHLRAAGLPRCRMLPGRTVAYEQTASEHALVRIRTLRSYSGKPCGGQGLFPTLRAGMERSISGTLGEPSDARAKTDGGGDVTAIRVIITSDGALRAAHSYWEIGWWLYYGVLPLDRAVSPLWKSDLQIDLATVSGMDLRYEHRAPSRRAG